MENKYKNYKNVKIIKKTEEKDILFVNENINDVVKVLEYDEGSKHIRVELENITNHPEKSKKEIPDKIKIWLPMDMLEETNEELICHKNTSNSEYEEQYQRKVDDKSISKLLKKLNLMNDRATIKKVMESLEFGMIADSTVDGKNTEEKNSLAKKEIISQIKSMKIKPAKMKNSYNR